jgi:hypothetical protein
MFKAESIACQKQTRKYLPEKNRSIKMMKMKKKKLKACLVVKTNKHQKKKKLLFNSQC